MNIIDAISNIVKENEWAVEMVANQNNRANSIGEGLEEYIKNAFAGTFGIKNGTLRNRKLNECFSYLGNQNNPPDMILKNGDAIEVKKIQSSNAALAFNSSHPKSKLLSTNALINQACRNCEDWTEKDIIYTVGVTDRERIKQLCMVYGVDYAADILTYEKMSDAIKNGISTIPNIEFAETKELGRVNKVDPLGISYLRVRGMWHIENPFRVFEYVYQRDETAEFNFMALIGQDKYYSFANITELDWLADEIENFMVKDVELRNPNNPTDLKQSKLITFKR